MDDLLQTTTERALRSLAGVDEPLLDGPTDRHDPDITTAIHGATVFPREWYHVAVCPEARTA